MPFFVGHQCKGKFLHSCFVGVEDEIKNRVVRKLN
jgi:hypothetical protein